MSNEKIVATRQHNVYCVCIPETETSERVVKAVPHPALQLLIDQLIRKRPRWHYILKGHASIAEGQDAYFWHFMWITEDGERLGEVGVDRHWRTGDITYEIDNARIRKGRQRGGGAKTIKSAVAIKAIIKNFAAKTIYELLLEASRSVSNAVGIVHSQARDKVSYTVANLRDELFNILGNNPQLMQQITFSSEAANKRFNTLPDLYERRRVAESVYDKFQQKAGSIVMLRGDKFWVCASNDLTNHTTYTYETAPKHILLAVAMLKVAEKGEVIEGIGTRADAEHFYVVDPQVHDE